MWSHWTLTHHSMIVHYFGYKWGEMCAQNDSEVANNAHLIRLTNTSSIGFAVCYSRSVAGLNWNNTSYCICFLSHSLWWLWKDGGGLAVTLIGQFDHFSRFPWQPARVHCSTKQFAVRVKSQCYAKLLSSKHCLFEVCYTFRMCLQRADVGASTDVYGATDLCCSWATMAAVMYKRLVIFHRFSKVHTLKR